MIIFPFLVNFDVFFVLLVEEVLLLKEEGLTVRLSLRLGFFLAGFLLPVFLLNGLSAYNILLSRFDRHLEPLEKLTKACVVSINFLLSKLRYDLLAVVDPVVQLVLGLLFTPNFVSSHLMGQPIDDKRLGFLPTKFVRVRLTYSFTLAHVEEEKCLENVWHLQDSECLNVVQDLRVLFSLLEPFGFDLKRFLIVMDLLEDGIIANHLCLEVVNIELQGVMGISQSLSFLSLSTFFNLDAHELKLAITIGNQT